MGCGGTKEEVVVSDDKPREMKVVVLGIGGVGMSFFY